MEEWRPVVGYEGLYEVSNTGQVRSFDRYVKYSNGRIHLHKGKVLSPSIRTDGYLVVVLSCNGKHKMCLVHRLVTEAFIPNTDNLPQVNHKDEDKTNNSVENLEWCDNKYNMNYGTRKRRVIETKIEKGILDPELCYLSKKEHNKIYYIKHRDYLLQKKRERSKKV